MVAGKPKIIKALDLPWYEEYPPYPDHGAKSEKAIYAAVGEALSYWEFLDTHQSRLFLALIPGEIFVPEVVSRAFGAVDGAAARNKMLQEAIRVYFHWYPDKELQKTLNRQIGKIANLAQKRNNIAHGIVQPLGTIIPGKSIKEWVLGPPSHATRRITAKQHKSVVMGTNYIPDFIYGPKEILATAKEFGDLAKEMRVSILIVWERSKRRPAPP
jgi:hypothetical protein